MKKIVLIIIVLMGVPQHFAQAPEPKTILNKLKEKFLVVKDYSVDVRIKIDVDFLKVPVTEAKILFKQPDKVRIKSEGFALLPKEGLNYSPTKILEGDYTSFFDSEQTLDGNQVYVVKIIPIGSEGNVVLSTLWIDKQRHILRKIETATKLNGVFTLDLSYDSNLTKYPLPSKMVFSFDISKVSIPKTITGEIDEEESKKKKKKRLTKGTVSLSYSNYEVNKGIDDSEFTEE